MCTGWHEGQNYQTQWYNHHRLVVWFNGSTMIGYNPIPAARWTMMSNFSHGTAVIFVLQKSYFLREFQAENLYMCPKSWSSFSLKFSPWGQILALYIFARLFWRARETLVKRPQNYVIGIKGAEQHHNILISKYGVKRKHTLLVVRVGGSLAGIRGQNLSLDTSKWVLRKVGKGGWVIMCNAGCKRHSTMMTVKYFISTNYEACFGICARILVKM